MDTGRLFSPTETPMKMTTNINSIPDRSRPGSTTVAYPTVPQGGIDKRTTRGKVQKSLSKQTLQQAPGM